MRFQGARGHQGLGHGARGRSQGASSCGRRRRARPSGRSRCRSPCCTRTRTCAIIDKPAGLVVHPAPGNWSGTLLNGLLALDPKAALLPRAGIVHRLDRDTSGLMVVARTPRGDGCAGGADRRARSHAPVPGARAPRLAGRRRAPCGRPDRPRSAQSPAHGGGRPAAPSRQAGAHADRGAGQQRRRAARCAARWKPGARTRSACTWRRSAIRWSATRSTAALLRPAWRGRRCMLSGSAFVHPVTRQPLEFRVAAAAPIWRRRLQAWGLDYNRA